MSKWANALHGKSIHIEGPDFTGKTTLIKALTDFLKAKGVNVDQRYQPGATPLGKDCRELLFHKPYSKNMDVMAERMLFSVDHADFVNIVATNKFTKESLILCDRYNPMSNIIYGYYGREMALWDIKQLNKLASRGVKPDLIIILEITEETMLERMRKRQEEKGEINKFDLEGLEFKRKIMKGYKDIHLFMEDYKHIIVRVDANGTPEEVQSNVLNVIKERFGIKED